MTNFRDTSHSTFTSLQSLKREIAKTATLTGNLLQGRRHLVKSPSVNHVHTIPTLTLPNPDDIDHAFDGLPLPPHILTKLGLMYQDYVQQVQRVHHEKFQQACRDLCRLPERSDSKPISLLIEDLRKVYESTYTHWCIPMMKGTITSVCSVYPTLQRNKKVPFNAQFTPLLEKYFEVNAYPSAPDRKALAKKTAMTPRQIDVWFQNHRKRAKESGKVIRKCAPNLSHNFLSSLTTLAPFDTSAVAKTDEEALLSSSEDEESSQSWKPTIHGNLTMPAKMPCALDTIAPPFAFPTPFLSSTVPYHFNTDRQFTFPPPVWMRSPSSTRVSHTPVKFDVFVSDFASKMNLRDATSRRVARRSCRANIPWYNATMTIPSRAPHPAFIKPHIFSYQAPKTIPLPSFRPTSLSWTRHTRASRKVYPFPIRRPQDCQSTHRNLPTNSSSSTFLTYASSSTNSSRLSSCASLSSVESPAPSSPELQPQTDNSLITITEDLQFLGDIFNPMFGAACFENTHFPVHYDALANKHDPNIPYSLPLLDNVFLNSSDLYNHSLS